MSKDPRRQPKQERSVETVRIILDAAQNVISRSGIQGATAAAIAKEAGISIGSLYQYFPTKDAVLAAWEERVWTSEMAVLAQKAFEFSSVTYPIERSIYEIVKMSVEAVARQIAQYGSFTTPDNLVSRVSQRINIVSDAAKTIASVFETAPDRPLIRAKTHEELELMCVIMVKSTVYLAFAAQMQHAADLQSGAFSHQVAAMMTRYMLGDAKSPERPGSWNDLPPLPV